MDISHENIKMLKYIAKKTSVTYAELDRKFKGSAEIRVKQLLSDRYVKRINQETYPQTSLGCCITKKGEIKLIDLKKTEIADMKKFWRHSVLTPILVSIVIAYLTTMLTNCTLKQQESKPPQSQSMVTKNP